MLTQALSCCLPDLLMMMTVATTTMRTMSYPFGRTFTQRWRKACDTHIHMQLLRDTHLLTGRKNVGLDNINREITQEGVHLKCVKLLITQVTSTSNYNAFKITQKDKVTGQIPDRWVESGIVRMNL